MRVSRAAVKFKVPRYQIDYWRKTGLLSNNNRVLDFEDLLKLKFITECRQKNLSLQKIRGYIHQKTHQECSSDFDWRDGYLVSDPGTLLIKKNGILVQPETGQFYFDYREETRGMVLSMGKTTRKSAADERLIELEDRFQESLESLDNDEIGRILNEILSIEPNHIGALIEFGNLMFEAERFEEAVDYYEKCLQLNPDCVEAIYNLANLYYKQKKYAVSIRYYNRSLELDPEFPEAYYNLALVYFSLNYLENARSFFEVYIRLDPDTVWRTQAEQFISEIDSQIKEEEHLASSQFQNNFDL